MFGWPVRAQHKVCFRVCLCVVLAYIIEAVLLVGEVGEGGGGLKDRVTLLWDEALN